MTERKGRLPAGWERGGPAGKRNKQHSKMEVPKAASLISGKKGYRRYLKRGKEGAPPSRQEERNRRSPREREKKMMAKS